MSFNLDQCLQIQLYSEILGLGLQLLNFGEGDTILLIALGSEEEHDPVRRPRDAQFQ